MKSVARRSAFFMASFILLIAYSLSFFALRVIQEGNFDGISFLDFAWLGGNALLTMMAFPLIFLFERSFGFLSEIRLLEISDSSNALLRELNEKAPGTFQHSLQVANLAEEAIHEIGGNELLVRVGALYHDIGKTSMSAFFTENQHGVNPHDKLEPEESARVIVSYVISGIEMARKARLPEEIIDFIRTHHGTSRVEYFYHQATQAGTEVDERLFRYPGPLPFTRETAVVMMADAVEASSRSLAEYSEASLSALIDRIIDAQQAMGQFDNSPLTFRDIGLIKSVFLRKLLNIYHSRIAYPEKKI
jgi:putative nucleotidyltransferase with HDIG domain